MLIPKAEPRFFWQLSPAERNTALNLVEKHRDLLWGYNVELATAPPSRRSQIVQDFCKRMAVTPEQLQWMQEANLQIELGLVGRRKLHRVK